MKMFRLANCYSHFLVISFLLLAFPLQSDQRNEVYISKEELHEVLDNAHLNYVYLGKEFSDLYEVISRINALEENNDSVIGELKRHIEEGFSIGLREAVLQALEHAEIILEKNISQLDEQEVQEISNTLGVVINQLINDTLTINTKKLLAHADIIEDSMITRSCGVNSCNTSCDGCPPARCCEIKVVKVRAPLEVWGDARFRKNVQIDGKLKVYGKSVFKDDVKFEDEVKFKDDVVFKEDVLIEGDLTVDGTVTFNGPIEGLTVIDVVIENLSATDIFVENLSVIDANIENLTVTDLVVLSCMDSLCVNELSVGDIVFASCLDSLCVESLSAVDAVVTGALSVNDAIIGDATITTLSATDGVIANLSVTDLAVANCIDNLCVNNLSVGDIVIASCIDDLCVTDLSVVDLTVSGIATINDAIIGDALIDNATITTLSATDAVIANLSVTDLVVINCIEDLCVDTLSVGDIVIASCLDSLCVNDLSAVDVSISGTLSANDAIIDDATIGTLSATDAVIANLSVTDLAVANCIDELCVINLSVTDISAGDIFAGSLSLCDLIVSCDIFMENTNGPAIGNIMKAGNRFVHNAGTDNTFVGVNSGNFTTTGAENVGIGRNALFSNTTGFNDTAVGAFSMNTNTIGANNAAYGSYALVNNIQGNDNVALGNYTLVTNTTGLGNTAVGFQAGYSLATGNNNVFVGNNAGLNLATGFTNVIVGYNSGLSLTTGDDNIYISNPGVASETGFIRIGTPATHVATFIQGIFGTAVQGTGISVFVDANGQLGTVVSSARFKHDIQDMNEQSEDIYKLRPVTFLYNDDATNTLQYGLIAEEVDAAFPALAVYDKEGKPYTVRYHLLPQLLLNELQKLNTVVQDQAITINELKKDNMQLNAAMSKVMAHLNLHV